MKKIRCWKYGMMNITALIRIEDFGEYDKDENVDGEYDERNFDALEDEDDENDFFGNEDEDDEDLSEFLDDFFDDDEDE